MGDKFEATQHRMIEAASGRPGRTALAALLLVLVLGLVWRATIPIDQRIASEIPSEYNGGPEVEGTPVEQIFGLRQGLQRNQLRKRSKAFVGKVVRISGSVKNVQSPSADIKFASLAGPGGRDSGVLLMFRVQFEPDYARLSPGLAVKASCVFRGKIEPNFVQFEDCRFTP